MTKKQNHKTKFAALLTGTFLLVTHTAQATVYTANILSDKPIKLTINNIEKEHGTGSKIALNEGDEICFVKGKGFITIEGGKSTHSLSYKKPACKILPKITQATKQSSLLSLKKSEISVAGIRGSDSEGKTSLYPDEKGNLKIESKSWVTSSSRLPIVLQIFDPKGNEVEKFTSNTSGRTSFVLPKHLLADKNGYNIKVSNQRGNVMIDSIFYLEEPKQ